MGADWRIEPLARSHERSGFDCGEPALNEYLARFARQNHESGIARTFVAVAPGAPKRILGYYSISVGAIDRENLPADAAKRLPGFPVPVARLARLAISLPMQARGMGEDLLMDALARCLAASQEIGIVAVLIDAKDDRAKGYYARFEFQGLPDHPLTLWLPMAAVAKLFRSA